MAEVNDVEKFESETVEAHLTRYIANRAKRTGHQWEVVRRYYTQTTPILYFIEYQRAHIVSDTAEKVRIYYDRYRKCWRRS